MFDEFTSWNDVISFINRGGWLFYKAPMDLRPVSVRVVRVYKNGKIRLDAGISGAAPFTADASHLSRMRCQKK